MLKRLLDRLKPKRTKPIERVEREVWYEFVKHFRAWDINWQNYLEDTDPRRPMSQDEFIDKMIKNYKLSDREQESSRNTL
jgi:hypothetical protein